jgi:hypothetical protein
MVSSDLRDSGYRKIGASLYRDLVKSSQQYRVGLTPRSLAQRSRSVGRCVRWAFVEAGQHSSVTEPSTGANSQIRDVRLAPNSGVEADIAEVRTGARRGYCVVTRQIGIVAGVSGERQSK